MSKKRKEKKVSNTGNLHNGSASLSTVCRTDLLGQIKAVHNPRLRHILSLNLTLYAAKNSKSALLCVRYSTQEKGNVMTTWFRRPIKCLLQC